ncbi:FAD-binding oxidoreductase [Kitasatospora sp. NPDC004289]
MNAVPAVHLRTTALPEISELRALLGGDALLQEEGEVRPYAGDRADTVEHELPLAVALPQDVEQVRRIARWASRHRVPLVPRGAGSGLAGGASALARGVVLSLERLSAIRELNAADQYAVAEAGVVNGALGRAAAAQRLFYPPDPGSAEVSTIGGNVATNAGGLRCVKYGVTADNVLGLEVVLADGRLVRTGGRTLKNVAGYDLTRLFVGSEGTLGIITAATLRLRPVPTTEPATFTAGFDGLRAAGAAVASIARLSGRPSMLELLDRAALDAVEAYRPSGADTTSAALLIGQADGGDAQRLVAEMVRLCQEQGATSMTMSSSADGAEEMLSVRRSAGEALLASGAATIVEDVVVPRSRLVEMLGHIERTGREGTVRIATVGHAGDGNLHPVLILPDRTPETFREAHRKAEQLWRKALDLGGSITGEHGVGTLKRSRLATALDPAVLDLHRSVKHAFDPLGILNPGKAF